MSLRKYARPQQPNLTEQYTVRLTKTDAELFESYCRDLNLTTAEAFRLLVSEELQREGLSLANQKDRKNISANVKIESQQHLNDTKKNSGDSTKKSSRAKNEESKLLSELRIAGQLPCPICNSWSSAGHFKGRHAVKHGFDSTFDFLQAHEADAKQMYQEKLDSDAPES